MNLDNETWVIREGDRIIHKKSDEGFEALSDLEKAIYFLWIVDYAIRNSGTLQPLRDLNINSISELMRFAKDNECNHLYYLTELAKDEKAFCKEYYKNFDAACEDLRYFEKNGN
jgi:hypothetical protein